MKKTKFPAEPVFNDEMEKQKWLDRMERKKAHFESDLARALEQSKRDWALFERRRGEG